MVQYNHGLVNSETVRSVVSSHTTTTTMQLDSCGVKRAANNSIDPISKSHRDMPLLVGLLSLRVAHPTADAAFPRTCPARTCTNIRNEDISHPGPCPIDPGCPPCCCTILQPSWLRKRTSDRAGTPHQLILRSRLRRSFLWSTSANSDRKRKTTPA